jgi:hypothetical protein
MQFEDFERMAELIDARESLRERELFERHTDSVVSCAALSTVDRQGARFYLEAVRGLREAR